MHRIIAMAAATSADPDPLHVELASMDLSESSSPVFPLFRSLPPELRTRIWRLAAPKPTVVERTMNNTTMAFGLRRHVPALLHACHESRAELLYETASRHGSREGQFELLHLSRGQEEQGKGVYMNCHDDTLLIYRGEHPFSKKHGQYVLVLKNVIDPETD